MLVSAKEMLTKAKAGKYAVGQFNINNLEWTKAILLTAEELKSPVILGVSEGAAKYMCGFKTVADELRVNIAVLFKSVRYTFFINDFTLFAEAFTDGLQQSNFIRGMNRT